MQTLQVDLERYVLFNDLAADTRAWYRRVVGVFRQWAHGRAEVFDELAISRFLADKQAAGLSPYYLKSLRNGLLVLLRTRRGDSPVGRVRSVRCPPLCPEAWTAAEVSRLLTGCDAMTEGSRFRWQLCILLAYYLGLDRCDVERVEQSHFSDSGALIFCRRKTGVALGGGVPVELLAVIRARCPIRGPICRMHVTPEWFRQIFAGIVKRAGLRGTFKKLRKSSGSLVEAAHPGTGHKHLGNTRRVFEQHYEARKMTRAAPTMPPEITLPW